jgi:S1-C subfamily serine protease
VLKISGYPPGIQSSMGDSEGWKSSVVRVVCSFRSDEEEVVPHMVGTGFVMADWPGVILTARHVVARPPNIPKERMKVSISAPNQAGRWEEVNALAVAYAAKRSVDVAALIIVGEAPLSLPLMEPMPSPGAVFDGKFAGYLADGARITWLSSRFRREGALLRALDSPSVARMSGGPLCNSAGDVCGIQSRDSSGQGLGTWLDFDVLNLCAAAARSMV